MTTAAGRYAAVNGLQMYYEVHGAGEPLALIHGGFGVVGMFAPLLPQLAEVRRVIVVELQGHGHTADVDRPLSFEGLADDVAALIHDLGLAQADVLGYSLGGGVALQTAVRHPDAVRKLVIVSAPCRSDGWYPAVLAGQRAVDADLAKSWIGSPMQQAYAAVAPRPEDWPTLAAKTGQLLRREYDWSEAVAALRAPVLIVMGDADSISPAHAVEFFRLLGGGLRDGGWDRSGLSRSRLAVLPATTHFDILFSPLLAPVVDQFLAAPGSEM